MNVIKKNLSVVLVLTVILTTVISAIAATSAPAEIKVEGASVSAIVDKLNGNQNRLLITVKDNSGSNTKSFFVANNAEGVYDISTNAGNYKVYVDVKGNTQIRACYIVEFNGGGGSPGTLTVRVFLPSDVADDGIRGPAPAGVIININNNEFGVTDADGRLTLQAPQGNIRVEAKLYPSSIGYASVSQEPTEHSQIDIILDEGKEIYENSTLVMDQLQDSVLDRNFNALTLRFLNCDGKSIVLHHVSWINLLDPRGGANTYVEQLFSLQPDGTLILNDIATFKSLLFARSGKILLDVEGYEIDGRGHRKTIEFYVSSYRVTGQLVAPPSKPDLSVAGISISATILGTDLELNTVSDTNGYFEFPLLPKGNLSFTGETVQGGIYYYGTGIVVLDGNKSLTVNMLNTVDLLNGVERFIVTPMSSGK